MSSSLPQQTSSELSVRPYRTGDESEVVDGFNAVFGTHRTLAHWQWKFGRNPYAGPVASVCAHASGSIFGHIAALPMRINFSGVSVAGGQLVDLYIRPESGERGFSLYGTRAVETLCHELDMDLLFTFPNPSSFPIFIRLGWTRVGFLKEYAKRLSIRDTLLKALRVRPLALAVDGLFKLAMRAVAHLREWILGVRAGKALQLTICDSLPEGYEELWAAVKTQEVISIWKDASYMRWRYDGHPDREFTYFAIHEGTKLVCVAVACPDEELFVVTELMSLNRNALRARWLLNRIALYASGKHFSRVVFAGNDGGFFASAFKDFEQIPSFAHVFCAKAFESNRNAGHTHAANWTITWGDGDAF